MSDIDRSRLAKLCALFSSDKDGEVLAAARRAQALVNKSGLSWSAVFQPQAKPEPSPVEVNQGLWEMVIFCQAHPEHLYANEPPFLDSIKKWVAGGGEPSEKQHAWLERIFLRVERLAGHE